MNRIQWLREVAMLAKVPHEFVLKHENELVTRFRNGLSPYDVAESVKLLYGVSNISEIERVIKRKTHSVESIVTPERCRKPKRRSAVSSVSTS